MCRKPNTFKYDQAIDDRKEENLSLTKPIWSTTKLKLGDHLPQLVG